MGQLPVGKFLGGSNSFLRGLGSVLVLQPRTKWLSSEDTSDRISGYFERVGQIFGFLIGGGAVAGGVYLANGGKELTGFGIFFTGVAALVGVFLYDRRRTAERPEDE